MKTVAFLFLCVFMLHHVGVVRADTENVLDSEVETSYEHNGEFMELVIEVTGKHHFETRVGRLGEKYMLNGMSGFGERFVFYGYIEVLTDTYRTQNAFVFTLDTEGNIVYEWISEDQEHVSEIVQYYTLGEKIVLQMHKQVTIDNRYNEFLSTYFFTLEEAVDFESRISVPERLNHGVVFDDVLYLGVYENRDYLYAINHDFELYDDDVVYGIINQQAYVGKANGFVMNPARVGSEVVFGYFEIDYPGHYVIELRDENVHFTVDPVISGVTDEGVYNGSVKIDVSSGYILKNGQVFSLDSHIDAPGYYDITVEGLNGYEKTISFTITSNIDGIFDGQTYQDERILTFKGEGYLNNRLIASGLVIDEAGEYNLRIIGENGYVEQHHFKIEFSDNGSSGNNIMLYMEIGLLVSAVLLVGGWFAYQKFLKK